MRMPLTHLVGEEPPTADGFIEPSKPPAEVRQEPYPLPKDFEWTTIDINDPVQVSQPNTARHSAPLYCIVTRSVRTAFRTLRRGRRRIFPIPILSTLPELGTTAPRTLQGMVHWCTRRVEQETCSIHLRRANDSPCPHQVSGPLRLRPAIMGITLHDIALSRQVRSTSSACTRSCARNGSHLS